MEKKTEITRSDIIVYGISKGEENRTWSYIGFFHCQCALPPKVHPQFASATPQ